MEAYELSPHRFRELKHFCLQYRDFKKELLYLQSSDGYLEKHYDPTSSLAIRETELNNAIKLIETTACETDRFLAERILKVVTEDVNVKGLTMPCSRECMEELRRRFYWLLHQKKGV